MAALRRSALYTLFGYGTWSAANFLIFTAIARFTSPREAGLYGMAIAICTPVTDFAQLNLRGIMNTDSAREFSTNTYLQLRKLSMIIAVIVIAILALQRDATPYDRGCIMLFGLRAVAESLADIQYGRLQQTSRLDIVSISMAAKGIAALIGFAGALLITRDLMTACAAAAATAFLFLLLFDMPLAERFGTARNEPTGNLKSLLLLAAPLGVTIFLTSVNSQIGRYLLDSASVLAEVAAFTAINYIIVIGRTVVIAIGLTVSTPLADAVNRQDRPTFNALLRKLGIVGLASAVGLPLLGLIIGIPFLRILYGEAYVREQALIGLILLGGGLSFVGILTGYAMTALREIKMQVPLYVAVLIVNVIAGFALLGWNPIYGVSWAAALSNLVLAAWSIYIVWRASNRVNWGTKEIGTP